eukprot:TRINITY_DN16292_c0_g1_i1.p1 TRINITY_DN16292_c0_g1~~TRINITY_DN16292_c0_g1_i1.p1  ORF type:complete len:173 (-),score=28.33 TRINITY_DN16292_c0_g1_i1:97-615(-)
MRSRNDGGSYHIRWPVKKPDVGFYQNRNMYGRNTQQQYNNSFQQPYEQPQYDQQQYDQQYNRDQYEEHSYAQQQQFDSRHGKQQFEKPPQHPPHTKKQKLKAKSKAKRKLQLAVTIPPPKKVKKTKREAPLTVIRSPLKPKEAKEGSGSMQNGGPSPNASSRKRKSSGKKRH